MVLDVAQRRAVPSPSSVVDLLRQSHRGFLIDRFVDLVWSGLEPHVKMGA